MISPKSIPQRVRTCLAPTRKHFHYKKMANHYLIYCWLLLAILLNESKGTLLNLVAILPKPLAYWTVRRMIRSGLWDHHFLLQELTQQVYHNLPHPPDKICHLITDKSHKQKTGELLPLAHHFKNSSLGATLYGIEFVLLIVSWGRFRIPVAIAAIDPEIKGHQNILFQELLEQFQPPKWAEQVIVEADSGFASKDNLKAVNKKKYDYVFAFARTWKTICGKHLKDIAAHTPHSCFKKVASVKPDGRRKYYWVFSKRYQLNVLGDVTVLFSKKWRNSGPKNVKCIVTNLKGLRDSEILTHYARRFYIEVTFRELKEGLHLGEMQVTKEEERVERSLALPVMANLLLIRLYSEEASLEEGFTVFKLKKRFREEVYEEEMNRLTQRYQRKLEKIKASA